MRHIHSIASPASHCLFRTLQIVAACLASCASALLFATTTLRLNSSPGDYIGGGVETFITVDTTTVYSRCEANVVTVRVPGSGNWMFDVANALNKAVTPDVYEGATRYPFNSPLTPGFNVEGDGRACNQSFGRFVVREIVCSTGNTIERLAVDAEQHCESPDRPPLRAYLRVNSTVPEIVPQPTASAGPDQAVTEGELVQLDGLHSSSPSGIAGIVWQVVSGPVVTLSSSTALNPTFIAPDVPSGGATIVLALQITGNDGLLDTNTVSISVRDSGDAETRLALVSHPGDYIGDGITRSTTNFDSIFDAYCWNSELEVVARGATVWNIHLAAPGGSTLGLGAYEGATRWPFQASSEVGMSIWGNGRGCNTVNGRFVISDYACGPDSKIQRLAADIEQHCESPDNPPLFAFLRVNSAVPVPDIVDRGCRLDIDGNGSLSVENDSPILLRALARFLGDALQGDLTPAPGATRRYLWQLQPYFQNTCAVLPRSAGPPGCSLDLDGDGKILLATDGLIATRIIAGLRDDSVLANALGAGATRQNWSQLASHLATCGLLASP